MSLVKLHKLFISSAGEHLGPKLSIACLINLLAVSTVFMTQPIFADLATSFAVDITKARYAFSVVSLFYTVSFFFLGPAADTFPKGQFGRAPMV